MAVLLGASSSFAEDAQRPDPGSITPPRAHSTELEYPEGARGDAAVLLELLIDETGAVRSCRVESGEAPFGDAACEQALRRFTFEPALRDGKPVAARIRFEARFREERSPEPAVAAPSTSPAEPAAPAESVEATEILVRGERRPVDVTTLRRVETRQLPGAFGDAFRAVEAQPGISPVISGMPYFFVRGAPPGNVGYFVDGIRVPMLYHAFIGPAVIHPAFLGTTEIHRGAYPARYGRFAGGIVAAETAEPGERFGGEAHVRLFDAGALLEAPFAGGRGHAAVAGRYSYTAALLSLLLLDDTELEYWDYQARASYELGPRDTLSVFGFGAFDFSGSKTTDSLGSLEFHRLDLRYDRRLGSDTALRLAATYGVDRTRVTAGSSLDGRTLGARLALTHELGSGAELRAGGDVWLERYELRLRDVIGIDEVFPAREDWMGGAYLDFVLEPESWLTFTPGVRSDVYREDDGTTRVSVDPRVTATFDVSERVRISHSLGLAHQRPNFLPPIFPALAQPEIEGGLQRSVQASSGVAVDLPGDVTASVTVFDNILDDVTDPVGTTGELDVDDFQTRALGHAYGLEVYVSRPLTRRLGGFLAYTLSRSTRSHDRIESLSAFDRTHVLNLALGYDLGKRWRVGTRLTWMSGVPTRRGTTEGPIFEGERAAPFFRVDARLEKRWLLGERAWWGLVAEVLNASSSVEVVRRSCNTIRCTESLFGPLVLPSIGVEAAF